MKSNRRLVTLEGGGPGLIEDNPGVRLEIVGATDEVDVEATDTEWGDAHRKLATHDISVDNETKRFSFKKRRGIKP